MGRPFSPPKRPLPSVEELNKVLTYEPTTGELFWNLKGPDEKRSKWWNSAFGGKRAGSTHADGYMRVFLNGVAYMSHRVIWKMFHGEDAMQIDHINGLKNDNRLENLRNVTHQVNAKNRKLYLTNTSGLSGVQFHKRDNCWQARIGVAGTQVHLGSFPTKEEALAARIAAQVLLDYHENHGLRTATIKEA